MDTCHGCGVELNDLSVLMASTVILARDGEVAVLHYGNDCGCTEIVSQALLEADGTCGQAQSGSN
jgi:hypothetical protein